MRSAIDANTQAVQATVQKATEALARSTQIAASSAVPANGNNEFVTNSLVGRIPNFINDPDNGITFETWLTRHEDVINADGVMLDEHAKTRLIIAKLDIMSYQRFHSHILPRKSSELSYGEVISILKELFGHNLSLISRRYKYLRPQCEDDANGTFDDYTGTVNRLHELAEMSSIKPDQMKCLIWICGLNKPGQEQVRQVSLKFLEENPETTLKAIHNHAKQFVQVQKTSQTIAGEAAQHIHKVETSHRTDKQHPPRGQAPPPHPCRNCGANHWHRDCPHRSKICRRCNQMGHLERSCSKRSFRGSRTSGRNHQRFRNKHKQHNFNFNSRNVNTLYVDLVNHHDPALKIFRDVKINGVNVNMCVDTGADLTVINKRVWKILGEPTLRKSRFNLRAANEKKINCLGYFDCEYDVCEQLQKGECYVVDSDIVLLGLDWIRQVPTLWKQFTGETGSQLFASVARDASLAVDKRDLTSELQVTYPDVFESGLGRCTKMQA